MKLHFDIGIMCITTVLIATISWRCLLSPESYVVKPNTSWEFVSRSEMDEGLLSSYESAFTVCHHGARSGSAHWNNMGLLPHGLMTRNKDSSVLDDRRKWGGKVGFGWLIPGLKLINGTWNILPVLVQDAEGYKSESASTEKSNCGTNLSDKAGNSSLEF